MAKPENDAGRVPTGTNLEGMSIVFSRTPAQEADLKALIGVQQDATSPLYHKWLTPDEFAVRFGVAEADITKVRLWLQQQGFSVEGVSRSRNRITFSGTVEQVEAAFSTELHYYNVNGHQHYAPATDISVPIALSSLVQSLTNLSTFKPRPHIKYHAPQRAPQADFTSSQTGSHFLNPADVATIYDISAAYSAGLTGVGQSIAVLGQSAISVSDIENFESAAGLPKKDPTQILVPNSGTAATVTGDESESDLDLEYSGAIAKGATIYFVYVGNSPNFNVWNSLSYAVESGTAPIISISYGNCETQYSSSEYASLNATLAQAAAQGQTVIAPAGDDGSTDCYGDTGITAAQQQVLSVDFPASSQYVTGVGGTEFSAADVAIGNTTYWESANGNDVVSSALSYIPEQVWNDDSSTGGLSAGGGGVSRLTPRPSWQTGVPGIAAGSFRLVPDLAFSASPNNAGFLYCSNDSTSTKVTGSCAHGFRDSADMDLTVAGGTSFDVPIFAGMVAIINQKFNSTGQGLVNPTLYTMAADPATYASAFHDVTTGGNQCTAGPTYCSSAGQAQFAATTGYDKASGLGSVDFYNLLKAWPSAGSASVATTTTLSAATTTPAPGASDVITITVASASSASSSTPTGSLTIVVDGTTATASLVLTGGSATYTFSSSTAGPHTVRATYSGDSTYASSTSNTLNLIVASAAPKGFTLSAANPTVSAGSSGTSTITITPQNGYTGTIGWTLTSNPSLTNGCFTLPNTTVSGTSAATTATLTVYTNSKACTSAAMRGERGKRKGISKIPIAFRSDTLPLFNPITIQTSLCLAGLLFLALLGFGSRKVSAYAGTLLLAGFALSGCGSSSSTTSSSSSSTPINAAPGSYAVTIVGTDTATASITASTTITLTID